MMAANKFPAKANPITTPRMPKVSRTQNQLLWLSFKRKARKMFMMESMSNQITNNIDMNVTLTAGLNTR